MGAFYGSVQVRGCPREEVVQAADAVATARAIRCLVGPERRGWTGIYPEHSGQDHEVGAAVAAMLSWPVLHLLLHDESVVAYWLYKEGACADSFFSRPGALGGGDEVREEAMRGRAEAFDDVVPGAAERLRPLLVRDRRDGLDEDGRFDGIARALRIENASTSYEYLKKSDDDAVRSRDGFVEVPAAVLAAEARAREEEAQARAEAKREGRLLFNESLARVEILQRGAGWLICGMEERRKVHCFYLAAPWPTATLLPPLPMRGVRPLVDVGRARLVTRCDSVCVLDVDGELYTLKLTPKRAAAFPVLLRPPQASRAAELPGPSAGRVTRHPSGDWIVGWTMNQEVAVASCGVKPSRRDLAMSSLPPHPFDAKHAKIVAEGRALAALDHGAAVDAYVRNESAKGNVPDETAIVTFATRLRRHQEGTRQWLTSWGSRLDRGRGISVAELGFAGGGRWFWLASTRGLHVYEWTEVATAAEAMPRPRYWFDTTAIDERTMDIGTISSVVEDRSRNALLFGGQQGVLYRMDLASGHVGCIDGLNAMAPPHRIADLMLSPDGEALLLLRQHGFQSHDVKVCQLWRYAALSERSLSPE